MWVLLGTAVLIAFFWDWRLALFALMVQYLVASLLFVDLLDPRLAIVKVLVGLFVCLILYWTARQVHYGSMPPDLSAEEAHVVGIDKSLNLGRWHISMDTAVRLGLTLLLLIVIIWLMQRPTFSLPGIPESLRHIDAAVLVLVGFGLLSTAASRDPLPAGMGLFTFLTGFELFYSGLEQSVALLAMFAGLNLFLAVVIAYLTQARRASWYALLK